MNKLNSVVCRVLFGLAFVLASAAVFEKAVNVFGYTVIRSYVPGRMLEFAGILLLFVIALLLREIREISALKVP